MEALKQALNRIVTDRDFSLAAAEALESVIARHFRDDERLEELQDVLASYRPGGGELLFDETRLESECMRVLTRLK